MARPAELESATPNLEDLCSHPIELRADCLVGEVGTEPTQSGTSDLQSGAALQLCRLLGGFQAVLGDADCEPVWQRYIEQHNIVVVNVFNRLAQDRSRLVFEAIPADADDAHTGVKCEIFLLHFKTPVWC